MSKRTINLFFLASLVALLIAVPLRLATSVDSAADPIVSQHGSLRDVIIDAQGVSFTLATKAPQQTAQDVTADGLNSFTFEPGAPVVGYYTTKLVVPPGADVVVSVEPAGFTQTNLSADLAFAPQIADFDPDLYGGEMLNVRSIDDFGADWTPDPAYFEADANYPNSFYALSEPTFVRDVQLVELALYPLAVNPVAGTFTHAEQLVVNVQFVNPSRNATRLNGEVAPAVTGMANDILNFEFVEQWRGLADMVPNAATTFPIGVETLKIEVNKAGIYSISYADMQAAGFAVDTVDPSTFELMFQGSSVAYAFVGDGDSSFEAGESIQFYGWPFDGDRRADDYVGNNIYWLWADGTSSLVGSASPSGSFAAATYYMQPLHVEQNSIFWTTGNTEWDESENLPDQWYWYRLRQNASTDTWDFDVTLDDPATASGAVAELEVEVVSSRRIYPSSCSTTVCERTKHVEVTLNNDPNNGVREWVGKKSINITTTIQPTCC